MSSPRPLSPKRDSIFNSRAASPAKLGLSTPAKLRLPVKLPRLALSLSVKHSLLAFHIYEDSSEEHALHHKRGGAADVHDDKENVLQPKVLAQQPRTMPRRPLANLSIADYPGYVTSVLLLRRGPVRLHTVYQPANYNNEAGLVHKFNGLPSYITPPRNAMKQILYRTGDGDDDVERRLVAKLAALRRKRAMSVGVNKAKAPLVTRNAFAVHGN